MPPLDTTAKASLPPLRPADEQAASPSSTSPTSPTSPRKRPGSITLPAPPELAHDPEPDTNTLAILLPHQAFFAPASLAILKDAFAAYGTLAHWAPVRAFGRVIAVYTQDAAAAAARREADGLKLDVALVDVDEGGDEKESGEAGGKGKAAVSGGEKKEGGSEGYFSHSRKSSRGSKKHANTSLTLRVYALPRTALDSAPDHLRPPDQGRNFLISPPGSPPEGWEPIIEEGPNMAPLADDLRRALEALSLNGHGRRGEGPEVILEEGGVRVEVEDTSREREREMEEEGWGAERVMFGGAGMWDAPTQEAGAGGLGAYTPSGRILPTARPPV